MSRIVTLVCVLPADYDVQVEGEPTVSKLLTALQKNEKYVHIREPIIQMVEEIGDKEPISFLVEQLQSENRRRRCVDLGFYLSLNAFSRAGNAEASPIAPRARAALTLIFGWSSFSTTIKCGTACLSPNLPKASIA